MQACHKEAKEKTMSEDRLAYIRQLVQSIDAAEEESARLKAELHDILELDGCPRKTRRDMLSKSARKGLFAGLRKEAQNRERITA